MAVMREPAALMTPQEVADHFQVSPTWVTRRVADGTLPHIRIGRVVRFRREDIDRLATPQLDEGAA